MPQVWGLSSSSELEAVRIISIVPSLTHLVCELGLRERLVGCTKFCIEPPGLQRDVGLIGGTKDPDMAAIAALAPTHILTNEEENKPEHIAHCETLALTFRSFPKSPHEVPRMIRDLGGLLKCSERASDMAADIEAELGKGSVQGQRSFLYFIWREPYMVASHDTYISHMLGTIGFTNVCTTPNRYPALTINEARALKPDLLLLSTEPYPFRKRDAERLLAEWPEAPEILRIDGQLMSWFGAMTRDGLRELRSWSSGTATPLIRAF